MRPEPAALAAAAARQRQSLRRDRPTVAVLSGPASSEDRAYFDRTPPSQLSSTDILEALAALGAAEATLIDVTQDAEWPARLHGYDLVISNLHGSPGEDGTVQGLLHTQQVPFLGSDVEASVLALNKYVTKLLAVSAGVPTPAFAVYRNGTELTTCLPGAGSRIAKPLRGGSSLDIRLLTEQESPPPVGEWLVEQYLEGLDVTVTVLEVSGEALTLPALLLTHDNRFYDSDAKLVTDRSQAVQTSQPADLDAVFDQCQQMALIMHRQVGASHLSRSDFVVAGDGPHFLEINTMPGISSVSNTAECARAAGLDYLDFIALLVGSALGDAATRP